MDRVRDLVAAGVITLVLAQDRDRLARKPAYRHLLYRECKEYGCKMRSLTDRGADSPEGELTDGILDQLANSRGAKTAERASCWRFTAPYGFRSTKEQKPSLGLVSGNARDVHVYRHGR
jgi:hypothetical protein